MEEVTTPGSDTSSVTYFCNFFTDLIREQEEQESSNTEDRSRIHPPSESPEGSNRRRKRHRTEGSSISDSEDSFEWEDCPEIGEVVVPEEGFHPVGDSEIEDGVDQDDFDSESDFYSEGSFDSENSAESGDSLTQVDQSHPLADEGSSEGHSESSSQIDSDLISPDPRDSPPTQSQSYEHTNSRPCSLAPRPAPGVSLEEHRSLMRHIIVHEADIGFDLTTHLPLHYDAYLDRFGHRIFPEGIIQVDQDLYPPEKNWDFLYFLAGGGAWNQQWPICVHFLGHRDRIEFSNSRDAVLFFRRHTTYSAALDAARRIGLVR